MAKRFGLRAMLRKRRVMRRRRLGMGRIRRMMNPQPTFTETYSQPYIVGNAGGVFQARISDIPQVAQYSTLYKQYRINWIKVLLVPVWNYSAADPNAGAYNNSIGVPYLGASRITYAINDSPGTVAPANELAVLTDNGCKIKPITNKFSVSFRPVPSVDAPVEGGGVIATKQKFKQWFNFAEIVGNNPLHQGVSYWISSTAGPGVNASFNVYYKVNFSLRDPQ